MQIFILAENCNLKLNTIQYDVGHPVACSFYIKFKGFYCVGGDESETHEEGVSEKVTFTVLVIFLLCSDLISRTSCVDVVFISLN